MLKSIQKELGEPAARRRSPSMNLYLMRHANAGVPRESAKLDAKRGLVAEGKEQCMIMGRILGALKVQPDIIISSPLKRALQTAQFVGNELGYESKVEVSTALDPGASYAGGALSRAGFVLVSERKRLFGLLVSEMWEIARPGRNCAF